MLEVIRERAQGWFAWAIVILLIIPFALWGVHEYVDPEVVVNVAVVDGKEISADEFQQAYQQRRTQLQAMLGENFDPAMIDEGELKKNVLEGIIEREVLLRHALDRGMRTTDARVGAEIRAIPALQVDGQFDKDLYDRLLRSQGYTVKGFEQLVRSDVLLQQLRDGILETVVVTPAEVDALIRLREQQRDIGYLVVPAAQYLAEMQIDDQAVAQYYKDNQAQFRTPEQVSVDYLELAASDLATDTAPIGEDELRQRYEERKSDFTVSEERRARHILIQAASDAPQAELDAARTQIEGILARVRKGEDFAALAREHSQDPGSASEGGDLGYFGRGIMDKTFEDAAFALKPGEVSEPVRSAFGYHLIKLEEIKGGHGKSFDEVRAQLESELRRQHADEQYYAKVEQLSNLTFENADNLEVASKALGVPIRSTGPFSRDNGAGIAAHPKVRNAAFSDDVLVAGHNSEPIELAPDHIVVLRMKEHNPEAVRPLEEVRAEIVQRLRADGAKKKAQEIGQTIVSRIEQGGDAGAIAREFDLRWERPRFIQRVMPDIEREIVDQAYRLAHPKADQPVVGGSSLNTGDFAVITLYAVKDGDAAAAPAELKDAVRDMLVRSRAAEEFQAYVDELKAKAEIKRRPENM